MNGATEPCSTMTALYRSATVGYGHIRHNLLEEIALCA